MRRLENVLKISLQDVLKMSWRRLEDVFKTSRGRLVVLKISWRRLEDVLKTPWRCFEDVMKTSLKRLEDVFSRCLEDIFKTSWRRLEDVWPRRIYWSWPRRLEDILKTYSQDVRLRRTYSSWSRKPFKSDENAFHFILRSQSTFFSLLL